MLSRFLKSASTRWHFLAASLGLSLCCVLGLSAQTRPPASQAVGSLQTSGDVFLNGTNAAAEQSLFRGDVVRTGPGGMAVVSFQGLGAMSISGDSEVEFKNGPYLATLVRGAIELRSAQAGRNLEIEFGKTLMYLPFFAPDAVGTVSLAPDGTGHVECRAGQVGVSAIEGTAVVFLKPGESVGTTADGKIGTVESSAAALPAGQQPASQTTSSSPTPAGKSHAAYILLGTAAAAGAGVGIAFALQHHNSPVSPSSP